MVCGKVWCRIATGLLAPARARPQRLSHEPVPAFCLWRPRPMSASLRRILCGAALPLAATAGYAQTPAQNDSAARAATRSNSLPLINTRTLKFTTDEGSWISLDLSRDGQTIIFDLLGDLYTLPIGGGTAKRITSGPAYDQQPRYSPDGKRIVFVSDRNGSKNLWLADADGTKPKIVTRSER